jgi:hypothetical protein
VTEILLTLSEYQLDPVLHQKFYDLVFLSTGQRAEWQTIALSGLQQLEITTRQARYLLDLFAIDENLQKLLYIEESDLWPKDQMTGVIDLRPNLPVIRSSGVENRQ